MAELRRCQSCKENLPLDHFWKNKLRKDGWRAICKECDKQYYREHRWSKLKGSTDYQAGHRKRQKKYIANHPEVSIAHRAARDNRDTLKKSACEECGASKRKLHMHHPDHLKPLEVITLCVPCHEAAHHPRTP